jgi:hypothetical protein
MGKGFSERNGSNLQNSRLHQGSLLVYSGGLALRVVNLVLILNY